MANTNSAEDKNLRVKITREYPYKLSIKSKKTGHSIRDIVNDGINEQGEQQFSVFLEPNVGSSVFIEHEIGGAMPEYFLIQYFIKKDPDRLGTEADGQLKIHFEEADEVPA